MAEQADVNEENSASAVGRARMDDAGRAKLQSPGRSRLASQTDNRSRTIRRDASTERKPSASGHPRSQANRGRPGRARISSLITPANGEQDEIGTAMLADLDAVEEDLELVEDSAPPGAARMTDATPPGTARLEDFNPPGIARAENFDLPGSARMSDRRIVEFADTAPIEPAPGPLAMGPAAESVNPIVPSPYPDRNHPCPYESKDALKSIKDVGLRTSVRSRLGLGADAALPDQLAHQTYHNCGMSQISPYWVDCELVAPRLLFAYHPLYFEDPNLERCGDDHGCLVQPIVSGVYFFGNVALLPYKIAAVCPQDYVCPLEFCEPCEYYSFGDNYIGPAPSLRNCLRSPCYSSDGHGGW